MNTIKQQQIVSEQPIDLSLIKQQQNSRKILSLAFHALRINLLLSHRQYILPLMFIINIQPSTKSVRRDTGSIVSELIVRYEGVLVYENGSPVNLKQFRFCVLPNNTILDKFFYICRKSYQVKFNYQISIPLKNNVNSTIPVPSQISQIISQRIQQKINRVKQSLINFLIRVGVMSCKEKSVNRYRAILMAQKAKNKLHQIINLHQDDPHVGTVIFDNSNLVRKQQINLQSMKQQNQMQKQSQKSKSTQSSDIIRSDITTCSQGLSQKKKLIKRLCCQKQLKYKKQQYKQVSFQNCPITKVSDIVIQQNQKSQQQAGGYFSVKTYNATVVMDINQEQNQQQIEDENNPRPKKILRTKTKLAIKQLNQQLKGNEKYENKIEHQMNIIKQINKTQNKYVCSYFVSANQSKKTSQDLKQRVQKRIDPKECITMENLVVSLQQLITNQMSCNYFQVIKELLKAVLALHLNGIVHHDIKPSNIMFNAEGHLKLIDFSQSIQCWRSIQEDKQKIANIGFTLPYSPLECLKVCEEGYANFKIDNYSVAMTILQVILGNLPVSCPKSLLTLIKNGWSTDQFHLCARLRANNLANTLLLPIKILCIKLMNRQSHKRLCIESVLRYLLFYQQQFFYLN